MVCAVLTGVSACGGGDSVSTDNGNTTDDMVAEDNNNAPIANDDIAVLTNGNTIVVNVLDNDTDSDGDTLVVSTISSSENGTAVIIENGSAIEYTPNDGYLGVDTITYTVSDGSLNSEANVELTVNQMMTLSGNVTHLLVAGSQVVATIGSDDFVTAINDDGSYSLEVTSSGLEEMVSVRAYGNAANSQEYVELISVVEDFSGLVDADDGDNILTASELHALNITQLSTALFLVAKDINADQSFVSFTDYETMVEQVDIDEVLQATGIITLLANDANYKPLLNENLLTLLDDSTGEFTVLAIADLAQQAEVNGIDEMTFSASIDAAIKQTLATPNITPLLTPAMLINKRIVQTQAVRAGWVAPKGRVMEFSENGTFILYSYNNTLLNDIPEIATGTWSINGSRVDMAYADTLTAEYFTYPIDHVLVEKYGAEVASAFENTLDFFVELEVQLSESERALHVIAQTKNTIKVQIDTYLTESIAFPEPVVEALDGAFGASYINVTSAGYDLTVNPSAQLATLSDADIQGDWVLFMPPSFSPESFVDATGSTTDFVSFFPALNDKVTLNTDGTVLTFFTGTVFNWSFDEGKIILTNDHDRLEYTPYYQFNNEWLTMIEHYQGEQLIDVYVDKIAQFDDTYSTFTDNLITELPMAYFSNFNSYRSSDWQGGLLKPELLFGFQFNGDGTVIQGIRADQDLSVDDGENLFFTGNTTDWNWSVSGREVVLNNINDSYNFYERYFDVLSVDPLGRVLILEYEIYDYFGIRETRIPPRLNTLTLENLEQWPGAWEDNDLQ